MPIINSHKKIVFAALILSLNFLSGCAFVVVGAAGGALIAHDMRTSQVILDDTRIEVRATDILYGDKALQKNIHVNVTSYNHVVLLTGEVLSATDERKVLDMVSNLDKVKLVHNELHITNLASFSNRSSDTWLTTKVKTKMLTTKGFDANRVKVVSESDSVYLMGIVSRYEGQRAAEIASKVEGVKRVVTFFEYVKEELPSTQNI